MRTDNDALGSLFSWPLPRLSLFLALIGACSTYSLAATHKTPKTDSPIFPLSLWGDRLMSNEPLFFVKRSASENACADLLFEPTSRVKIADENGATVFEAGRDFSFHTGDRHICLKEGSRIPFKLIDEIYPKRKSKNSIERYKTQPWRNLLFSEDDLLGQFQVYATYDHLLGDKLISGPPTASSSLPITFGRLEKNLPVKIGVLGDSIAKGSGAFDPFKQAPFGRDFIGLFALELRRRFKSEVQVANISISGATSSDGIAQSKDLKEVKPNLTIIAFGANDSVSAQGFGANIIRIMEIMREANPKAEFILISPLTTNPDWFFSNEYSQGPYRDQLRKLERSGVLFADVGAVWSTVIKRKKFLDVTSNGVNHPNNFGHRLYAEVLLTTFLNGKPTKR